MVLFQGLFGAMAIFALMAINGQGGKKFLDFALPVEQKRCRDNDETRASKRSTGKKMPAPVQFFPVPFHPPKAPQSPFL